MVAVYQGTGDQKLWYVAGRWTSADRFLRFEGGERPLSLFDSRRGSDPSIAIGFSDAGNAAVLYRGTSKDKLWFVEGLFDASGRLQGQEAQLTMGFDRR